MKNVQPFTQSVHPLFTAQIGSCVLWYTYEFHSKPCVESDARWHPSNSPNDSISELFGKRNHFPYSYPRWRRFVPDPVHSTVTALLYIILRKQLRWEKHEDFDKRNDGSSHVTHTSESFIAKCPRSPCMLGISHDLSCPRYGLFTLLSGDLCSTWKILLFANEPPPISRRHLITRSVFYL